MVTPRARSISTFSRVAAWLHIFTFMAGATTTGAVDARYKVVRKSSAIPRANFAMMSAVAGATSNKSVRCATAMCSMALSRLAPPPEESPKRSVITFCPLSDANVSGVTNSRAPRVITTSTVNPSCCRRRTSSAALYAATPPVTPSVIRIRAFRGSLLPPLVAVLVRIDRIRLHEFVLDQAVLQLVARDSRGLQCPWILDQRRRTRHNLPRAPCRKHYISKLALRSFRQHSHFSLSPQTMPEVFPHGPCAAHSCSAARLQSPAPHLPRAPRLHSQHNNRSICRTSQSRPAPWPAAAQSLHRDPDRACAAFVPALLATAAK